MNLLKFLPGTKLTIIHPKSPDEIIILLKTHISDKSSFFEGYVIGYEFHIQKRVGYFEKYCTKPSSAPLITIQGRIAKHPLGAEIKIKLIIFQWVVLSAFCLIFLCGIFTGIIHNYFMALLLLPMALLWLIIWQMYDGEVIEAKINLKKLFVGKTE